MSSKEAADGALIAVVTVQRLWFKTSVKLGNLLYEIGDFSRLSKVRAGLSCRV